MDVEWRDFNGQLTLYGRDGTFVLAVATDRDGRPIVDAKALRAVGLPAPTPELISSTTTKTRR